MIMKMKFGDCTCTGKDIGYLLGAAGVGGLGLLSFIGGWNAQHVGSLFLGWLGYSVGLVLFFGAKMMKWMGSSCPVHSMHGMMAMMDEKGNGKKKRR